MKNKLLTYSITVLLGIAGLSANAQNSWLITGNSNTGQNNFIGTTNFNPLIFRTNNVERMRLTRNGQLGYGVTAPIYALQIQNPAFQRGVSVINNFSGSQDRIAVYAYSVNAPDWGYGVEAHGGYRGVKGVGDGGNTTGGVIGVLGQAFGSAGSRYGVWGYASGGSFNAAGYFNGAVWADSYFNISDRKFKTGITQLKSSVSLEQLMQLKPSAYEFNTAAYPKMGLAGGKQMGLIADEVKQVFPELVMEGVNPAEYSEDKKEVLRPEEKFEGVNYIGFIPVLIASLQEQQKTISTLQDRITKLEASLAVSNKVSSADMKSASLLQNQPNPFSQVTNIRYNIPQGADAQIRIYDASGNMVKTMRATESGQVQLNAFELKVGTYTYTLVVNGNVTGSKKMVLLK